AWYPHSFVIFFLLVRRSPRSPLFPYTPFFRSPPFVWIISTTLLACASLDPGCPVTEMTLAPTRRAIFPTWIANIARRAGAKVIRSEEHTSELQSRSDLVCRPLPEKKKRALKRS